MAEQGGARGHHETSVSLSRAGSHLLVAYLALGHIPCARSTVDSDGQGPRSRVLRARLAHLPKMLGRSGYAPQIECSKSFENHFGAAA